MTKAQRIIKIDSILDEQLKIPYLKLGILAGVGLEYLTTNQRVGGSSPSWVTILKYDKASIRWVEVFFVAKILAYHIVIVLLLIGDCNKGRLI